MKTKFKKIGMVSLATLLAFSTLAGVGCGGGGGDSDFDNRYNETQKSEMTELVVGVYNGGLGYAWAQDLAKIFEEKYKDVQFEEGKKGVYVSVQPKKSEYEPGTLIPNMKGGVEKADVYVVSGAAFDEYIDADVVADMTSVITADVYDANGEVSENGTQSILDRLDPYFKEAYNKGTADTPKYYQIPYEWGIRGFVYDYDLFEEEGWLTYDGYDGTPVTTEDFIDLLNKITGAGYYGYTMSPGDAGFYTHSWQYGFLAQYEGEEKAMLNLTFDGTATFAAGTFDAATCAAEGIATAADGTQSVTITNENAWLLAYQTGKDEYIKFIRQIIHDDYVAPTVTGSTQSFTEAQKSFIMSCLPGERRIAMIFDGEWWENEARTQFDSMGKRNEKYAYGKRDFRFMPIPQATGGANEKQTFCISGAGPCFINKKTKQADLAAKWVQMMYSVTGCKTILKNTGMTLPVKFEMSEGELAEITPFARSTYNIKQSNDIQIFNVHTEQNGINPFAINSQLIMGGYGNKLTATVPLSSSQNKLTNYNNAFVYFIDNTAFSAEKWIKGSRDLYTKEAWKSSHDAYFGN